MERYRVKTVTINDQMLDIYCEFAGDIDGYARCGKPSQRLVIDDEQWIALTNFLQELHVLASGRATPPYAARLRLQLTEVADSPSVAARLLELAARPLATPRASGAGQKSPPL
jgi:hypothetical protein